MPGSNQPAWPTTTYPTRCPHATPSIDTHCSGDGSGPAAGVDRLGGPTLGCTQEPSPGCGVPAPGSARSVDPRLRTPRSQARHRSRRHKSRPQRRDRAIPRHPTGSFLASRGGEEVGLPPHVVPGLCGCVTASPRAPAGCGLRTADCGSKVAEHQDVPGCFGEGFELGVRRRCGDSKAPGFERLPGGIGGQRLETQRGETVAAGS